MKIYAEFANKYTAFNKQALESLHQGDVIQGTVKTTSSDKITVLYQQNELTFNRPQGFNHQLGDLVKLGVKSVSKNLIELNYTPKMEAQSPQLSQGTELSNELLKGLKGLRHKNSESATGQNSQSDLDELIKVSETLSDEEIETLQGKMGNLNQIEPKQLLGAIKTMKMDYAINPTKTDQETTKYDDLAYNDETVKAIIEKLEKYHIPVNSGNIAKLRNVINQVNGINSNSYQFVVKAIQSPQELTVKSLAEMSHSSMAKKGPLPVSQEQIATHLKGLGISPSEEAMGLASAMIEEDIPISGENVQRGMAIKAQLSQINEQTLIEGSAFKLALGDNVMSLKLSEMVSTDIKALFAENRETTIKMEAIVLDSNETNLIMDPVEFKQKTINQVLREMVKPKSKEALQAEKLLQQKKMSEDGLTDKKEETKNQINLLENKKVIQKILIQLTQPNLVQLSQENCFIGEMTVEDINHKLDGIDGIGAQRDTYQMQLVTAKQVLSKVYQSAGYPIGKVVAENSAFNLNTLSEISEEPLYRALKAYEANGTVIRKDLGDRIDKAFSNLTAVLEMNAIPVTEQTMAVGKIIAATKIDWTIEQFNLVGEKKAQLEVVLKHLTPEKVVDALRSGRRILDEPIDELAEELIDQGLDTSEMTMEKLAKDLLTAINQTEDIELNHTLISVYQALNQINQTQGKALGMLVKNDMPINVRNLLEASNHLKKLIKNNEIVNTEVSDIKGEVLKNDLVSQKIMNRIDRFFMNQAESMDLFKETSQNTHMSEGSRWTQALSLPLTMENISQAQKLLEKPLGKIIQERITRQKNDLKKGEDLNFLNEEAISDYIGGLNSGENDLTQQEGDGDNQSELAWAKKLSQLNHYHMIPYAAEDGVETLNIYFSNNITEELESTGSFSGLFGFDFGDLGKVKVAYTASESQMIIDKFESTGRDRLSQNRLHELFIEQCHMAGFEVIEQEEMPYQKIKYPQVLFNAL